MKTFRRFYGNILEQMGGMMGIQTTPPVGNDPTTVQARNAQKRAILANITKQRKDLLNLNRTGTIREQLATSQSPALSRLLARRDAARQRTQERIEQQRRRQAELAAQKKEEKQRQKEIQQQIQQDRLNR